MKQISIILLLIVFAISSLLMPFCNFDDARIVAKLYEQHLQQDEDGNIFDFIGEKILVIGSLFEDEDFHAVGKKAHHQNSCQLIQIQNGYFNYSRSFIVADKTITYRHTVYSFFRENKFSVDLSSAVFHPPSVTAG